MRIFSILISIILLAEFSASIGFGMGEKFRGNGVSQRLSEYEDSENTNAREKYYYDAIVDNTEDISKQKTWKQRFFMNDTYYGGKGSPVFIWIGGESALNEMYVDGGLAMSEYAKKHKAMLIALEHRFYGKSTPTITMATHNLRLLTAEQALADAARFIMNAHEFLDPRLEGAKWIAFGGSYPGNMAAWLRTKYPHLVYGAFASSAPVRIVTNMYQYMEVVGQALKYYGGEECYNSVKTAMEAVAGYVKDIPGKARLSKDFEVCDELNFNSLTNDIATFEDSIMGVLQGITQYNHDSYKKQDLTVEKVCEKMKNSTDKYKAYVDIVKLQQQGKCVESLFRKQIDRLRKVEFDGKSMSRQWTYQTCNEFGYFQTTSSQSSPFKALTYLTLKYSQDICNDAFGISVDPQTNYMNARYGGLTIGGKRIFFTNGNIDPWHSLSVITKLKDPSNPVIFMKGTSHCADSNPAHKDDPVDLKDARVTIQNVLDQWVRQH